MHEDELAKAKTRWEEARAFRTTDLPEATGHYIALMQKDIARRESWENRAVRSMNECCEAAGWWPHDMVPEEIKNMKAVIANLQKQAEQAHASYLKSQEYVAKLQRRDLQRVTALRRIAKWHDEFPEVADHEGIMRSYGFMRGSNGERDFMRKIAQDALDGEEG